MRKYILAILSFTALGMQAQDTYQNDELLGGDDINGTARFVGMGGAMGALGADLSLMGTNPAGIGLYRRNDVGISFGAIIPKGAGGWEKGKYTQGEGLAKASLDQLGCVWSVNTGGEKVKFVNLGFGYRKLANYNNGYFADHYDLKGMSQMDINADFANYGKDCYNDDGIPTNLAGLAVDNLCIGSGFSRLGTESNTTKHSWGSRQGYDINASGNVSDRFYWGATLGFEKVNYKAWSDYAEYSKLVDDDGVQYVKDGKPVFGDYTLSRDVEIRGWGIKALMGLLVRPIEDNPLRVGITMETPTWYRMNNSTFMSLPDYSKSNIYKGTDEIYAVESYYEFTMRSPVKGRLSIGSTVGNNFAWDVEYEFANYGKTKTGIPTYYSDDPNHSALSNSSDMIMNEHTKNTLKWQNTLRAGVEYRPVPSWALRLGYNFISSRYKKNVGFDTWELAGGDDTHDYSDAMIYNTNTDYMRLGATNIITLGLGYKYKKLYVDLAYKVRAQKADYYAFDSATLGTGLNLDPAELKFVNNQLSCTLGFKF